ncbi:hypothetical protein VTN77DRAFT_9501 [Rasamsonia byssochlamydoides]|uniref:uncharacterized protein n=1 Tax=Rasamsonia byssochlamydoides TaxID=89139 RepID=UPI0037428AAB
MARKRGHDELELALASPVSPAKRSRTTPPRRVDLAAERDGDANNLAAETSSAADDTDDTTSSSLSSSSEEISSEEDGPDSDEETTSSDTSSSSSSSSSSSEDEDDDEDNETDLENREETREALNNGGANNEEEPITFVPGRPKPRIQRVQNSGLLSRLSSFLPQLQAANEDLEREIARGQDVVMDDVKDEEGQYIEMNLGLGVLEEKNGHGSDSDIEDSEKSEGSVYEDKRDSSAPTQSQKSEETHVLDRLMGNRARGKKKKPAIEEVD